MTTCDVATLRIATGVSYRSGVTRLEHVIARNVIELREEKSATQSDLAEKMRKNGFAWQTNRVTQIETLRRPVSLLEVVGLSRVFHVPVGRLLEGADNVDMPDGTTMPLKKVRGALVADPEFVVRDATPAEIEQHKTNTDDLRKIAKRLGATVAEVDEMSYRVFGKSLFAERDQRAGDLSELSPRSAQTKRGHVTRGLIEDLRPALAQRAEA